MDNLGTAMLATMSGGDHLSCPRGRFRKAEGKFIRKRLEGLEGSNTLLMHHIQWQVGPII